MGLRHLGVQAAGLALRPAAGAASLGWRVTRGPRDRVLDAGGRAGLSALDAALASAALERVLEHTAAARVPQRIVDGALADGLAEQLAARLLEGPELERIVARTLDDERLPDALAAALERPAAARMLEQALDSPGAERLLSSAVESPGAERLVATAMASPGTERLVVRVTQSALMDETVERLVEATLARLSSNAALWRLVDEVAQSPSVTAAISHQGWGFADQVAGDVRDRARGADDRLERVAWRLLRRRPAAPAEAP